MDCTNQTQETERSGSKSTSGQSDRKRSGRLPGNERGGAEVDRDRDALGHLDVAQPPVVRLLGHLKTEL